MIQLLWLIPIGYAVGAFGTLIGAGGGFILVPVLLLLYPDKSPDTITSISLAVVFFNALSGSVAYAKMKRIDYKTGIIFAIATIPGAVLGSLTVSYIPRNIFNGIFGVILFLLAIYLFLRSNNDKGEKPIVFKHFITRYLTDNEGIEYTYSYNPVLGVSLSVAVGYLSSLLGIGGGIIHVPALINLLNFPVHIATATSHFILVFMALSSTVVHIATGTISSGLLIIAGLSIGVLFGAQLGAKLSNKIKGGIIIKSLAVALGLVGIRIFIMAFSG